MFKDQQPLGKLKDSGTQIVFDMNHRPALWKGRNDAKALYEKAFEVADIALPGLEDFNFLYGFESVEEIVSFLAPFSFKLLVIKNGSRAVTLVDAEGEVSEVGLTPVKNVVDTTSAGDAFNGVFLRPVDLCCTHFAQQYIGSHIIENASDTILA